MGRPISSPTSRSQCSQADHSRPNAHFCGSCSPFCAFASSSTRLITRWRPSETVREQRQAALLRLVVLGDILAHLGDSDLDRRDAIMLSVLYMLALRISEIVGLDYERRRNGVDVIRMTEHGLELELIRSKTSQELPVIITVERAHNPRGFAALEHWIARRQHRVGHASLSPHPSSGRTGDRITDDGVNRAIKAAINRYYIATGAADDSAKRLASRFSGHSGRVGFVVAAKEAGAADTPTGRVVNCDLSLVEGRVVLWTYDFDYRRQGGANRLLDTPEARAPTASSRHRKPRPTIRLRQSGWKAARLRATSTCCSSPATVSGYLPRRSPFRPCRGLHPNGRRRA